MKLFENGSNMYLTGPGGTGKSLLIGKMYENALNRKKNISVTAMTGCAAYLLSNLKTRTLHSWSGVYRFNEKEIT